MLSIYAKYATYIDVTNEDLSYDMVVEKYMPKICPNCSNTYVSPYGFEEQGNKYIGYEFSKCIEKTDKLINDEYLTNLTKQIPKEFKFCSNCHVEQVYNFFDLFTLKQ